MLYAHLLLSRVTCTANYFALCIIGHAAAEGSGPPSYCPLTAVSLSAIAAHKRAVLGPLQSVENQYLAEAEITFETSRTTSNVVFLRCLVSIPACGKVFRVCGNSVPRIVIYSYLMH